MSYFDGNKNWNEFPINALYDFDPFLTICGRVDGDVFDDESVAADGGKNQSHRGRFEQNHSPV